MGVLVVVVVGRGVEAGVRGVVVLLAEGAGLSVGVLASETGVQADEDGVADLVGDLAVGVRAARGTLAAGALGGVGRGAGVLEAAGVLHGAVLAPCLPASGFFVPAGLLSGLLVTGFFFSSFDCPFATAATADAAARDPAAAARTTGTELLSCSCTSGPLWRRSR